MGEIVPFPDDPALWEQHLAWRNAEEISHPTNMEIMRERDASARKNCNLKRYALMRDGRMVANGMIMEEPAETGKPHFLRAQKGPETTIEDLAQMASFLHEQCRAEATTQSTVWFIEGIEMYERVWGELGYKPGMVVPESKLDLAEFDLRATPIEGVSMVPFDYGREPSPVRRLFYDAFSVTDRDVPVTFEYEPFAYEVMDADWAGHILPHSFRYVAWAGGEIVGLTELYRNPVRPEIANTGLTGVRREFRRRGLARSLKIASINGFKQAGGKEIWTQNEENNPMLQLNIELGFKPAFQYVCYMWEPNA